MSEWCPDCGALTRDPNEMREPDREDDDAEPRLRSCWRCVRRRESWLWVEFIRTGDRDEARRRLGEAGQAIVELALTMPVVLGAILGVSDLALFGWAHANALDAAQTIVAVPESAPAELARIGCVDGAWTITDLDGYRTLELACPYVSLTSLMPDHATVTASIPVDP